MPETEATTGVKPGDGVKPDQAASAQQNESTGQGAKPDGEGVKPDQSADIARLTEALRKERESRTAAEGDLRAIRDKDLPEAERTKRELSEVTADRDEWKTKYLKTSVGLEAAALGFANPKLAYAMLQELDLLETDRDGIPTNVESSLKKLLRDNPGMATAATRATGDVGGGVKGTGRTGATDMNALLRAGRHGSS